MKKLYFVLIGFLVFSGVEAQVINFPDANFKAALLSASTVVSYIANGNTIDANGDGEIEQSEALQISILRVSDFNITDLTGIGE